MGFFDMFKPPMASVKAPTSHEPYTVVLNEAENTAEVNLYGQVVKNRPRDFWTGEEIDDSFIVQREFLEDLNRLDTYDKVTFRINSVGGDADAGKAIYTRIREMSAETTTIVDGLAASAASIIFMAGDHRKMSVGTQLMIHGASQIVIDYLNAEAAKKILNALKGYDSSIADIYADRTGQTLDSITRMMTNETWLSTKDAVEKGFADEVINTTEPSVSKVSGVDDMIVVNGNPLRVPEGNRPALNYNKNIVSINKVFRDAGSLNIEDNVSSGKEDNHMTTLDEMKTQYPEFCDAIKSEALEAARVENEKAVEDAVMAERQRIKDIEDIQNRISDKELVNKAKYGEEVMDAKELAFEAMQSEADIEANALNDLDADAKDSGAADVVADPVQGTDAEQKTQDVAVGAAMITKALNN